VACASDDPFCDDDVLVECGFTEQDVICQSEIRTPCPNGCVDAACVDATCGDGALSSDETCDDGNAEAGDGCSADCQPESGWTCDTSEPTVCTAPDLVVRIVAAAYVAQGLSVTYVVNNDGGADADPYRVDLWDTRAGGFDNPPDLGGGGPFSRIDHPALAAGGSRMFTETIQNPASGSHVAFAIVDTLDEQVESDETDNVSLGFAWTNTPNTLHTTFSSSSVPTAIDDDGSPTSAFVDVSVSDPATFYASVNVTHPVLDQLTLRLIAPNGAVLDLASDLTGANLSGTTFGVGFGDIAGASAPYTGTFAPAADWDSPPSMTGTFAIEIVDGIVGQTGTINAFSVTAVDP
jgi:cysteine-rich repeat protein